MRPSMGRRKILWLGYFSVFQCFVTAQTLPAPSSRAISSKEIPRSLLIFSFFSGSQSKIIFDLYAYTASMSRRVFLRERPQSPTPDRWRGRCRKRSEQASGVPAGRCSVDCMVSILFSLPNVKECIRRGGGDEAWIAGAGLFRRRGGYTPVGLSRHGRRGRGLSGKVFLPAVPRAGGRSAWRIL